MSQKIHVINLKLNMICSVPRGSHGGEIVDPTVKIVLLHWEHSADQEGNDVTLLKFSLGNHPIFPSDPETF